MESKSLAYSRKEPNLTFYLFASMYVRDWDSVCASACVCVCVCVCVSDVSVQAIYN